MWDQNQLRQIVHEKIGTAKFVVVSNREPYIHVLKEGKIEVMRPASGLVTALDPMLRACQGTWIAHGSGNADRKVVDDKNCVAVPPDNPRYKLRRIWLSKPEEDGYYYGFSNDALWPLCHIVYARPYFDQRNWEIYKQVNQKFANAVLSEIENQKAFVWVQDYHLALVPAMIKEKRPDALVAQFWHIPWPNPEAFRVCPWKDELLWGMLGNDLLGFHLRYHCDNFLNSVDQSLEVRIDRERLSVFHHGGLETLVRPFPISIDYEGIQEEIKKGFEIDEDAKEILYSLPEGAIVALGLDRMDYTKGIPERIRSVGRFLEKYPEWQGKFVFLQMGALSRIHLPAYKAINDEINRIAEEINWKLGTDEWSPIILVRRHISHPDVLAFYQRADICIVSSLHDGMNLVAKEYIASRTNEDGALILSKFTGAARELESTILVNPYDIESFADAIETAVSMPPEEKKQRMQKMRETVAENNIYKWAGKMIEALARLA
jgi:trehalose 6-phosphate synthase